MPTAYELKGLRERKSKALNAITKLREKAGGNKEFRGLTSEEQTEFDKLKTEFVAASEALRVAETQLKAFDDLLASGANAEMTGEGGGETPGEGGGETPPEPSQNSRRIPGKQDRDSRPRRPGTDGANHAQNRADHALALQGWCRAQYGFRLRDAHKAACKRLGLNPRAKEFKVRIGGPGSILKRGLSKGTAAAGGYTVPEGFSGALESNLVDYSNVRGVCDEFTTDSGNDFPWPKEDDTSNEGEIIGENGEVNFADNTFDEVVFYAFKFSSKGILVSYELLEDSAFDLDTFLGGQLGIRLGRIQGRRFTTGTGSGQPMGVVTASTLGVTTAGAAAFTAPELTRLAFSVDLAYRNGPKVGYMMHDSVVAYALLLVDGQQRPLLRESYRDGISILACNGFPVWTNQFMEPTVAAVPVTAKKHVLFGDFSKHKVRDVGAVRLRKLEERYAERDQVGFIGFQRADSRCVNTNAIKHLLQA